MEEDITSTDVTEDVTQPADDPILATLEDTDDDSIVEETLEQEEPEAETESEVESTEEETPEDTAEESEQIDPKEEARRRYEERQRVIAERKDRIKEQTKDYVEGSEDEYDQRLRQMEVQEYTRTIENNENTLISEFERAKNNPELQIFNPDSELFNEKAYDKAMRDYNAGYIGYDRNGNMVEIKGSLYEHLTETADLLQGAIKTGAVQQVRDSRKMKSSADVKPAAPPKEQPKDSILDILKSDD